jgi:hypothetical protein
MSQTIIKSGIIKFSGICNIGLAISLAAVPLHPLLGVEIPTVWAILLGALLLYTASTLIIGSSDLHRYGSVIIHEAMLRFAAAALLVYAALFIEGFGPMILLAGISDAFWGVVYLMIVPKATNLSFMELFKNEDTSFQS